MAFAGGFGGGFDGGFDVGFGGSDVFLLAFESYLFWRMF